MRVAIYGPSPRGRAERTWIPIGCLYYAVVHLIEIMGEAANRVSKVFKDDHPEIPWSVIISTRNRLIHGCNDLEKDIIWKTIIDDIPPVIDGLEAILGKK